MSKDVFGFEKLDITRIQMLRSITDLAKLILENNKPEERAEKLQPLLGNIY